MIIVLKYVGWFFAAYFAVWLLQFIWGGIGFVVFLRASGNNPDFINEVLNLDNKDKTKWLLMKWPLVLWRMKRGKLP